METIRTFEASDRAAVIDLWQAVFGYAEARNAPADVIDEFLRHGHGSLLVAVGGTSGQAVLGTVMAGYDGHRGWLYRLSVAPQARRRGIGRKLVDASLSHLQRLGCKKVNLQMRVDNQAAPDFWRALGFAVEARTSMGRDLELPGPTASDAGC